jgi:hypothetical protein
MLALVGLSGGFLGRDLCGCLLGVQFLLIG